MATLIGELPNTAKVNESLDNNGLLKRTRSIELLVRGGSGERESEIKDAPGVPRIGWPFMWDGQYDPYCVLKRKEVTEFEEQNGIWKVTCSYDSQTRNTEDQEEEPDQRVPEWSWGYETQDVAIERDVKTGEPIANSAGEPIPVSAPYPIIVLTIERYERQFWPNTILEYANRVNDSDFWGAEPGTALMAGISAAQEEVEGRKLWKVTYTIKFKIGKWAEKGWQEQLLDYGTKYIDASGDEQTFKDAQGNPTSGRLDGSGGKLASGSDPVYLDFSIYKTADFNALNLGPW